MKPLSEGSAKRLESVPTVVLRRLRQPHTMSGSGRQLPGRDASKDADNVALHGSFPHGVEDANGLGERCFLQHFYIGVC